VRARYPGDALEASDWYPMSGFFSYPVGQRGCVRVDAALVQFLLAHGVARWAEEGELSCLERWPSVQAVTLASASGAQIAGAAAAAHTVGTSSSEGAASRTSAAVAAGPGVTTPAAASPDAVSLAEALAAVPHHLRHHLHMLTLLASPQLEKWAPERLAALRQTATLLAIAGPPAGADSGSSYSALSDAAVAAAAAALHQAGIGLRAAHGGL
jgi:hypothetical protein